MSAKNTATQNANNGDLTEKSTTKARRVPMILKLLQLGFTIGGHISPVITGHFAYKLWFTPTRFKTPASEQEALNTADIEYQSINNQNIATYHWGRTGPAVLLVHGWSGRGTQMGPFIKPLLAAGYRVISFDAPAHGKSSGKQTNLYQVVEVIQALQKHYGVFNAVITHSFGGPCIAIALQRGFKTSRVVSISPPATTLGLVKKFAQALHIPVRAERNLMDRIEASFGKKIWHEISMKNTVRELHVPAMVIHDAHDTDIHWKEGFTVAQAWHNADFIKTSGLGHRRILRDNRVIASTVGFIKA